MAGAEAAEAREELEEAEEEEEEGEEVEVAEAADTEGAEGNDGDTEGGGRLLAVGTHTSGASHALRGGENEIGIWKIGALRMM